MKDMLQIINVLKRTWSTKQQNRKLIVVVALLSLTLFSGCNTILYDILGLGTTRQMEVYAEARYKKAMNYMKESQFELAQEEFAIVASTANSQELRLLALEAYNKADKAISVKR